MRKGEKMKKILFGSVMAVLLAGVAGLAYAQYDFTLPGDETLELFFKAASTGDLATLQRLIGERRDLVNARSNKDGKTALHIAVMVAKYDAAKLLLDNGANPNARDYYCKTPYYYARVGYRPRMAQLLLSRGAHHESVRFFPHCCTWNSPHPAAPVLAPRCSP